MEEAKEITNDKWRMYALHLENGIHKRMIMVHVGRPVSFKTVCNGLILDNMELTIEKTKEKILTSQIIGIQKIPNDNTPSYELVLGGILKEII